ncbi:MAG: hypothetical protein J6T57_02765 [Alphaproteobacteria bacterium]|nr:hypothetical protein [Alphaproteobacteria bacterium]
MKNVILFCTGLSGSGKSYFIENKLPKGLFYNLRSATTRAPRDGEIDGDKYFFRDEKYFDDTPLVTNLWVNRDFWKPGDSKWMYGVPESEVISNLGKNFVYAVIEPKYVCQMINWFRLHGLDTSYIFKIAWFIPPKNNMDTVNARANMPNDATVRRMNTCDAGDFLDVDLRPDYILRPVQNQNDPRLSQFIGALYESMTYLSR